MLPQNFETLFRLVKVYEGDLIYMCPASEAVEYALEGCWRARYRVMVSAVYVDNDVIYWLLQAEPRQSRSDVRSIMDKLDPSFWPTRGRRSSSSSSEETPPFWAHRGRAVEDLAAALSSSDEVDPPFWAHRGRQVACPEHKSRSVSVEEPRWVMFDMRDADESVGPDTFWISQGSPSNGYWQIRGKEDRKKNALRTPILPHEDFYPVRGKRAQSKTI